MPGMKSNLFAPQPMFSPSPFNQGLFNPTIPQLDFLTAQDELRKRRLFDIMNSPLPQRQFVPTEVIGGLG
jgi:hypothetical protein